MVVLLGANAVAPPSARAATASGTVIQLSAAPSYGLAPLLVAFNLSVPSGPPPNLSWSFGDGTYLNGSGAGYLTPSHSYELTGRFTANVTATWSSGSVNTSITITVVAANLAASLQASPDHGIAPLTVNFTGAASGGQAPYTSYAWTFGDGGSGAGAILHYTYTQPGRFTATLEVTDSGGRTANQSTVITVTSTALAVSLLASNTTGTVPLNVTFNATPSGGSHTYLSYAWTFGDGTVATGATVVHDYLIPGNYTTAVRVVDSAGANATATTLVRAEPPPFVASVIAGPLAGTAPLAVGFQAALSGGTFVYGTCTWNFGDGATASGRWVNHTFANASEYVVHLTATDSWGAIATATVAVNVSAAPGSGGTSPKNDSPTNDTPTAARAPNLVWPYWALALSGVIVLAAVLVWTRRPGGRPPTGPTSTAVRSPPASGPPPRAPTEPSSSARSSPAAVGGPAASAAPAVPVPQALQRAAGGAMEPPPSPGGTLEPASAAPLSAPTEVPRAGLAAERQLALRLIRYLATHPSALGDGSDPLRAHTQGALAAELGVTRGAVSKVLRRLDAAGIVASESAHVPGSGRRMRVYRLTSRGERIGRALDQRTGPWDAPARPAIGSRARREPG